MKDPDAATPWSNELTLRVRMKEARPFAEALSTSLPQGTTSEKLAMAPSGGATATSTGSRAPLRNLRPEALIVLFTPVLVPFQSGKSGSPREAIDPFESLGRALSQGHRRVRHVPYVPKVGVTETHVAFLGLGAVAVVVVVCEPAGALVKESLKNQLRFADGIAALRKEFTDSGSAPSVLVRFGDCAFEDGKRGYDTLVRSDSYGPSEALEVSEMLFAPAE